MLIDQERLAAWLGYKPSESARIRRCLESQGVKVLRGKNGRVCTTTELIASAGKTPEKEVIFE